MSESGQLPYNISLKGYGKVPAAEQFTSVIISMFYLVLLKGECNCLYVHEKYLIEHDKR